MPDLTGLPALDLAIGLSFIFLLLSLLASALQEYIASVLQLRAKTLLSGLGNMLEGTDAPARPAKKGSTADDRTPAQLTAKIYEHPMIRSFYRGGRGLLKRGENRLPSYISPRSFALALLGTLAPGEVATDENGRPRRDRDVIKALRTKITDAGLEADVNAVLLGLLDDARGDVDKFRKNLEEWFDDTMARVSGWYKRQAQLILIAIAVVVTLALNANALTLGERLWEDPALRAAVVQEAGNVTEQPNPDLDQAIADVEAVQELGVPLGWTSDGEDPRFVGEPSGAEWWFRHIGGWLLTIGAISLGAPFWFDTLSRFSRLRSSGKPEQPLPASAYGQRGERVS